MGGKPVSSSLVRSSTRLLGLLRFSRAAEEDIRKAQVFETSIQAGKLCARASIKRVVSQYVQSNPSMVLFEKQWKTTVPYTIMEPGNDRGLRKVI